MEALGCPNHRFTQSQCFRDRLEALKILDRLGCILMRPLEDFLDADACALVDFLCGFKTFFRSLEALVVSSFSASSSGALGCLLLFQSPRLLRTPLRLSLPSLPRASQ